MQTKVVAVFGEVEPYRVQGLITSCIPFQWPCEAGHFMQNDCGLQKARWSSVLIQDVVTLTLLVGQNN